MSKEYLEALSIIIETLSNDKGKVMCRKELDVLIQALQRLEKIDNSSPSEAFECNLKLYKMVESAGNDNGFNLNEAWKYHNIIKQTLIKAKEDGEENEKLWNDLTTVDKQYNDLMLTYQEQKNVLEIAYKKNVNIRALKHYLATCDNDVSLRIYNSNVSKNEELTQEEFELLKKYFKLIKDKSESYETSRYFR